VTLLSDVPPEQFWEDLYVARDGQDVVSRSSGQGGGLLLGVCVIGSQIQTARVRELRRPGVVMVFELVLVWVSWGSSMLDIGSRLSAVMMFHSEASMPSVVFAWLSVIFSPQKTVLPFGKIVFVESEGVHIVVIRLGKTLASGHAAPEVQARYMAYGRACIDAMGPIDRERIRLIERGLGRGCTPSKI
jgi:hypothetical protein